MLQLITPCSHNFCPLRGVGVTPFTARLRDFSAAVIQDTSLGLKLDSSYIVFSTLITQQNKPPGGHTHTHTHPFNGPLSGTTQVSRYQKGKTNLDFTEARDSEWQTDASTPPLNFLQAGCPSCRPTNSVKALKVEATGGHTI